MRTEAAGGVPVGVFAQFGGGILGDEAGGGGVARADFVGGHGFDGDGGEAEFVEVVAQHRAFAVFGGRGEGDVHAQAERPIAVEFVRAVEVGRGHDVFGDFARGFARHAAAAQVLRLGVGVGDVRGDDVDGGGDFAAVEFGQTGGVVEKA